MSAALTVGDRVFYSGNMANIATAGAVVELRRNHYGIRFDDEDRVAFLPCAMLVACTASNLHHANCLFELDDYRRQRAVALAAYERQVQP
jgi:hypothetical protein